MNAWLTLGCGVLLFLAMLEVIADVTGRYLFANPVPGTLEIGESLLAFVIFLSLAYVLIRGGHIRVTLFTERLPPKWQAWFDIFATAVGFSLMLLIAWQSLPFALHSYKLKEVGVCFPIPLYPAKVAFFVGSTLFCIQFFIQFISHLLRGLSIQIPASGEKK